MQKLFDLYNSNNKEDKKRAKDEFIRVWGDSMAEHFLSKYNDAESLIWALDIDNLELFIYKF